MIAKIHFSYDGDELIVEDTDKDLISINGPAIVIQIKNSPRVCIIPADGVKYLELIEDNFTEKKDGGNRISIIN
jgi:hypothetical protein